MKKIILVFIPLLLLVLSCEKKDKKSQTSVENDKANIFKSLDNIVSCMGTMKDGELMNAFVEFANISYGEAIDEEFVEDLFDNMEDAFEEVDFNEDEDRLPFENFTGTWSYGILDHKWSHSKSPSNKIIIKFPSDKSQTRNNVTASLDDYADKKYVFDSDDVWLPVSFNLSLMKDGSKLAELDLDNLDFYQSNDLIIPTDVSVSLFVSPFTLAFNGERTSSKQFMAEARFDDGSGCEYILNGNLKLAHSDYENLDDEDFTSIEGFFSHNQMKLEYFLGLGKIAEFQNTYAGASDDEINDNIDVKLLMNRQNVGEITIKTTTEVIDDYWGSYTESSSDFIITYKNGESESVEVYLEPFFQDLETVFEPILGDVEDVDVW
jgi:hypothetical protein